MKHLKNGILLVIFSIVFVSTTMLAGETKNEVIFDCNKPTDNGLMCLACNIYHEARGERIPGMWLVALATKNRVDGTLYPLKNAGPKVENEGFTNDYCRVVYEQRKDKKHKQWVPMFSWTLDGAHDKVYNSEKWGESLDIAGKIILSYEKDSEIQVVDITYGCQWYHQVDVEPYWKDYYYPTVRIGGHQCYTLNEEVYLKHLNSLVVLPNFENIFKPDS